MAAEANPSLFHQSAIVILARQAALKQIKQQRKRLGLRETLPIGLGGHCSDLQCLAQHDQ